MWAFRQTPQRTNSPPLPPVHPRQSPQQAKVQPAMATEKGTETCVVGSSMGGFPNGSLSASIFDPLGRRAGFQDTEDIPFQEASF
jgi:predicted esterase YcpF (UPF0227 family)